MRNAWRFVFGCALGLGLGYTATLLLSPGRPSPERRPTRTSDSDDS